MLIEIIKTIDINHTVYKQTLLRVHINVDVFAHVYMQAQNGYRIGQCVLKVERPVY